LKLVPYIKNKLNIKEIIKNFNDIDKLKVILFDENNLNKIESLKNPVFHSKTEKNIWRTYQNLRLLDNIKLKKQQINNYI
jgi:hypothetical protein